MITLEQVLELVERKAEMGQMRKIDWDDLIENEENN